MIAMLAFLDASFIPQQKEIMIAMSASLDASFIPQEKEILKIGLS